MTKTAGGSFKIFRRIFFCLTVQKIFVGEHFSVSLISGIEKVWLRGGEYQVFTSNFFCLRVPKNFRTGFLYCCNNFG